MADLGFLPVVRRLLDRTPQGRPAAAVLGHARRRRRRARQALPDQPGDPQRRLRRSRRSSTMAHHVLHVDARRPAAGAGRPDVGARAARWSSPAPSTAPRRSTRQLDTRRRARRRAARQPRPERPRPATSRRSRPAPSQTLVATDIAARGIHVDDVELVVHADPPVEHKAYLHRSGRTARAGDAGTVVTLMTDDQVRDVRDLTRKAGIKPTTTRLPSGPPAAGRARPRRAVLRQAPRRRRGRGARRGSRPGWRRWWPSSARARVVRLAVVPAGPVARPTAAAVAVAEPTPGPPPVRASVTARAPAPTRARSQLESGCGPTPYGAEGCGRVLGGRSGGQSTRRSLTAPPADLARRLTSRRLTDRPDGQVAGQPPWSRPQAVKSHSRQSAPPAGADPLAR